MGWRKRRFITAVAQNENKFIGSLPVPINNGLIWNSLVASCCTRASLFYTGDFSVAPKRSTTLLLFIRQQQFTHTWWICICDGQRTRQHGNPPCPASGRMRSRCRPCIQRRKMSAWSQTYPIVHSSNTDSSRRQKIQLILRTGMTSTTIHGLQQQAGSMSVQQ